MYRILKKRGLISPPAHGFIQAADEYKNKTEFVHQMWQTDFTYFRIIGWGWYFLSTVIDDFSRYIVHWELCESMKVEDVKRTLDRAIIKAKLITKPRPRLLSDNGSCYVAKELKQYLKESYNMDQLHGRPFHLDIPLHSVPPIPAQSVPPNALIFVKIPTQSVPLLQVVFKVFSGK